jgi:hypothetical protein
MGSVIAMKETYCYLDANGGMLTLKQARRYSVAPARALLPPKRQCPIKEICQYRKAVVWKKYSD